MYNGTMNINKKIFQKGRGCRFWVDGGRGHKQGGHLWGVDRDELGVRQHDHCSSRHVARARQHQARQCAPPSSPSPPPRQSPCPPEPVHPWAAPAARIHAPQVRHLAGQEEGSDPGDFCIASVECFQMDVFCTYYAKTQKINALYLFLLFLWCWD